MNIYALKAPARNFTVPAWVTVHNAELAGAALVVILLAFAVLRLSKGGKAVPAPPPAPKKSGGGMLLLLAGLGGAGLWYWDTHLRHAPAGAVNATPSPSPTPVPTVTRTVAPHAAPHVSLPSVHLTNSTIVIIFVIAAVVAIVLLGPVLRKRGD